MMSVMLFLATLETFLASQLHFELKRVSSAGQVYLSVENNSDYTIRLAKWHLSSRMFLYTSRGAEINNPSEYFSRVLMPVPVKADWIHITPKTAKTVIVKIYDSEGPLSNLRNAAVVKFKPSGTLIGQAGVSTRFVWSYPMVFKKYRGAWKAFLR